MYAYARETYATVEIHLNARRFTDQTMPSNLITHVKLRVSGIDPYTGLVLGIEIGE